MSRTRRLAVVLLLNLGLVAALVVAGLAAHSLAVFAAGADYLADAAAIGVSLLAIWLAARPVGYPRATTIAALVNAGWLLALNIGIAAAAAWRLAAGAHRVEGLPVLVVSAIAAAVMLAGALILSGDAHDDGTEDLNVKAVLLDTVADAAAAAGVAASGAVILAAGGNRTTICAQNIDPERWTPRIYSVEVLAKYKADHEAKMAPRNLRPAPLPLDADTVDLSLLPVAELPGTLWRASS